MNGGFVKNFEMAHADDPAEIIKATQKAIISSMKEVLAGFKNDIGGPGLTWEQLDYFLNQYAKKDPKIITQDREL